MRDRTIVQTLRLGYHRTVCSSPQHVMIKEFVSKERQQRRKGAFSYELEYYLIKYQNADITSYTLTSRFNNELCLCLCVCVFMCLCLCEHCPFENGILAHHRGVSDPNHFYLCLFCICLYLHCVHLTIPCSLTSRTFGVQMVCVYIALR